MLFAEGNWSPRQYLFIPVASYHNVCNRAALAPGRSSQCRTITERGNYTNSFDLLLTAHFSYFVRQHLYNSISANKTLPSGLPITALYSPLQEPLDVIYQSLHLGQSSSQP